MDKPAWVSEGSIRKYDRALAILNKENAARVATNQAIVPITEKAVKELYVKWGGLVLGGGEDEEAAAKEDEEVNLEAMNKAELVALATEKGIDVDGLTKAEIVEKLQ